MKLKIILTCLLLIVAIGLLDYITGDYSALLFYFIPIALISHFNGKRDTLLISLICSATFIFVNFMVHAEYFSLTGIRFFNSLMEAACFPLGGYLLSRVRQESINLKIANKFLADQRQELESLNRTLEERISQAVNELREKDQMLIQQYRLAVMGEMINNIAHQWRQPLNALGLVIQEVQFCHNTGQFSPEFLKASTAKGMELIQFMSRTIDDFRNFFRADKEAVTFSINQVVSRTLSLIESSFKELNIGITVHSEGDPMIHGYPNEYSQVILNILGNARDALVEKHADDAIISINVFSEGGKSVLTITDNAGGIVTEIINKLFDPYFTTKGPDKGTGIGLFMSKTIVEKNMGGRLTVRNTGTGAEFRIEI